MSAIAGVSCCVTWETSPTNHGRHSYIIIEVIQMCDCETSAAYSHYLYRPYIVRMASEYKVTFHEVDRLYTCNFSLFITRAHRI